jgi:hypothetical protein
MDGAGAGAGAVDGAAAGAVDGAGPGDTDAVLGSTDDVGTGGFVDRRGGGGGGREVPERWGGGGGLAEFMFVSPPEKRAGDQEHGPLFTPRIARRDVAMA